MDEKIVKDSQGLAKELVNDTISRQAAIDAFTDAVNDVGVLDAEDINAVFQRLPSAQPERMRGKWIRQDNKGKPLYGWFFCSECGAFCGGETNFCSECGADMREDEQE